MLTKVSRISCEKSKTRDKLKVELKVKTAAFSLVNQLNSMPFAFKKHSIIGDTWQDT